MIGSGNKMRWQSRSERSPPSQFFAGRGRGYTVTKAPTMAMTPVSNQLRGRSWRRAGWDRVPVQNDLNRKGGGRKRGPLLREENIKI